VPAALQALAALMRQLQDAGPGGGGNGSGDGPFSPAACAVLLSQASVLDLSG
jgi:hypothetical protein